MGTSTFQTPFRCAHRCTQHRRELPCLFPCQFQYFVPTSYLACFDTWAEMKMFGMGKEFYSSCEVYYYLVSLRCVVKYSSWCAYVQFWDVEANNYVANLELVQAISVLDYSHSAKREPCCRSFGLDFLVLLVEYLATGSLFWKASRLFWFWII
jgi:hypothetical protein